MGAILAVFDYTLREHVRRRAWLSTALFGLVLIAGGLVTSVLAADQRARMMLDLGLAAIEAIGLVTAVFLTVGLVLSEIESRAVFLILTHPVPRWQYLFGRWLGTLAAVALGMAGMALLHLALLAALGWSAGGYGLAWSCSLGSVAMMSALSLLLSLALTSEAAAMAFAGFFWLLGHFTAEMSFVADRSGSPFLRGLILVFARAAPDFARLDYRDALHGGAAGGAWAAWAAVYALAYCAACLALAVQLFEQKEF
ncbi:MAG: ABC transporter permease subunit [Elusimicrobia bacterium]|nr:ABC transporter permease subunit [Elusimicrobiota bacterium]